METLKDFFSDLKDRISNPFVSSFVISWLILNYQIVIALFFYKQVELRADGYTSYLDVIASCYNLNTMIKYPLGIAALYTFVVPFFTGAVKIFQAWILTSTDELIFRFTKNKNAVSVELHKKLKTELDETVAQYLTLIKSAGVVQEQNKKLELEMKTLKASHLESINKLNEENDDRIEEQLATAEERYQKLFSKTLEDERESYDQVNSLEIKIQQLVSENGFKDRKMAENKLSILALEKNLESIQTDLGKCKASYTILNNAKLRFEKELKTEKQMNSEKLNELRRWYQKVTDKAKFLDDIVMKAEGKLNEEVLVAMSDYFKVVNREFPLPPKK